MKLGKLITSLALAGTVLTTGVGATAAQASTDDGQATVKWKDPNTGAWHKEYGAKSKPKATAKVKSAAKPIVKKTTYVDRYRGFATFSYKQNGKWKTEVADSQKATWKKAQKEGQTFTKKITFWYHGHKYTQTIKFKK